MSYGNYLEGTFDTINNGYTLVVSGSSSGYQSSGLSIGGDTSSTYGFKLSTDQTKNALLDVRGDSANTMSFRHKDHSTSVISTMLELANDSSLTGNGFGAIINGRVSASAYYVGQIDTRAPTLPGVYMSNDVNNVGKFSVNKGDGTGGFSFSTYDASGNVLTNNLNLLNTGEDHIPFYGATENEDDIDDIAIVGVDRTGKIVRFFDINARLQALEERTADLEDEMGAGVGDTMNNVINLTNSMGLSSVALPTLPKFVAKNAAKSNVAVKSHDSLIIIVFLVKTILVVH